MVVDIQMMDAMGRQVSVRASNMEEKPMSSVSGENTTEVRQSGQKGAGEEENGIQSERFPPPRLTAADE